GVGELLLCPLWNLHYHVVDGRLETGGRLLRDVVGKLIQAVTDRQPGGDLGDGKAGGFGSQRGAARHAGVHFNHHHASRVRINGELDIRAARLHTHGADHLEGRVAHQLVFLVGERLRRRHGDGIPRVYTHRVKVLDG